MKKLCIYIPTFNRSECIDYVLKCSADCSKDYDIDFYICDSSTDGKTINVINNYKDVYGERLIYELIKDYPDKTTDLKLITSFPKIQDAYEYIHVSGDGFVIDIPSYMEFLKRPIEEGYDIIHFNNHLKQKENEYNNGKSFASENGWFATCYGATVLSSRVIKDVASKYNVETFRNTGFLLWYWMLCGVASDNEKIIAYNAFPLNNNPHKPTNSSYQKGKFINFWIVGWNRIIESLPDYYDEIKSKLKKDAGKNMHLYTFSNLLRLRETSNLERKVIKEQKQIIKKVTDVPFWHFTLVSFVPKDAIKFARNIKKRLK